MLLRSQFLMQVPPFNFLQPDLITSHPHDFEQETAIQLCMA